MVRQEMGRCSRAALEQTGGTGKRNEQTTTRQNRGSHVTASCPFPRRVRVASAQRVHLSPINREQSQQRIMPRPLCFLRRKSTGSESPSADTRGRPAGHFFSPKPVETGRLANRRRACATQVRLMPLGTNCPSSFHPDPVGGSNVCFQCQGANTSSTATPDHPRARHWTGAEMDEACCIAAGWSSNQDSKKSPRQRGRISNKSHVRCMINREEEPKHFFYGSARAASAAFEPVKPELSSIDE